MMIDNKLPRLTTFLSAVKNSIPEIAMGSLLRAPTML